MDDKDFFADIQKDLNHMNLSSPTGTTAKKKKPTIHQPSPSPSSSDILLPNSQLPFVGRQSEIQALHEAVQRISLDWMENPSEVLLVNGSQGVGKTTFVNQAAQQGPFWKVLVVRGACEENATATQPFASLTEILNDLATQLLPQKPVWKPRLEEALGGEGPLVATIVPALCPLLQCSPMEKRILLQFDTNTPKRSTRLGIAIRDLLQAVSEYQPLVMIVDNLHWADPDSLRIWQDLLTSKSLLNVLFVGVHDVDVLSSASSLSQAPFLAFYKAIEENAQLHQVLISPLTKAELQLVLSQLFPYRDEDVPDLVDLVSALTKGNPLWVCQLLKFWNESHLISYQSDPIKSSNWVWNRKRLKKEIKKCIDDGLTTYQSVEGIIRARLSTMPRKIQFVVLIFARMRLTQFPLPLQKPEDAAQPDQLYKVFVAAAYHKAAKEKQDPIGSSDELVKMAIKASTFGILKRNPQSEDTMSFTNDLIRTCASTIVSEYYEKMKKEQDQEQQSLKIGLYIGTELSRLSVVATRSSKKASETAPVTTDAAERKASLAAEQQRERYKLLAADILYQCKPAMDASDKIALTKISIEAAEIAIAKSAFQSAIVYLERAIEVSDVKSRWLPTQYDVTLRTFLFLARMRACCGKHGAAKAAVEEIFAHHGNAMKDRVFANQVLMVVLQAEGRHDDALIRMLDLLDRLGEVFSNRDGEGFAGYLDREIHGLRKTVDKMQNQPLLNPPKMTDKKLIDVMMCLATLAEISRHAKQPNPYQELSMVRMMQLSLRHGFTRQYPVAFSLFSIALRDRGHIKDAHRMGQITEKMARLTDFYGGDAVARFHWHVSHWRRTYQRNLDPVLQIYNAQVDSGDFCHVGFSISTYIQYHLVSGFDISKLSDNMHLFHGLYADYRLRDEWQLEVPQQAICALMGETEFPTVFFGITTSQQEDKLEEFLRAGQPDAIDYLHLLRLFVAFFFQDYEVMQMSLDELRRTRPVEGVWIPWVPFMECFLLIQSLSLTKGKERKELKERIEALKDQVLDWYNSGAPNPNAMSSILEAEYVVQREGLKKLPSLRLQMMYDEAIEAARNDGATHLEALACERAGAHFRSMFVHGSCVEYLSQSHKAYDHCHYVGKVIDLETKYSDILQIANRRVRPASAYLERNATALLRPSNNHQKIGGGQGEIKTVNVLKGFKKATRVLRRPIAGKLDSRWGGGGGGGKHKLSLDEGEADPESHPQSPLSRKSPGGKHRGRRGSGGGVVMDGSLNDSRNFRYSPAAVPSTPPSGGGGGGGSPRKKAGLSGLLFGRRNGKKKPTDGDGDNKEFIDDFGLLESPRRSRPPREAARENDMDGMELSFVNHHIDVDGSGNGGSQEFVSPKKKKNGKEKTTKEKKKKKMES